MYYNWQDLSEKDDSTEYLVSTVGYLLPKRKKGHVVVALNLSDDHVGDGIAIPKDMVVSITPLVAKP